MRAIPWVGTAFGEPAALSRLIEREAHATSADLDTASAHRGWM